MAAGRQRRRQNVTPNTEPRRVGASPDRLARAPDRRLFNCACTRSSWRLTERYFQFWRGPSAAAPALYPEARGMDRPPTVLHCHSWLGRGVRPEPAPKGPRSLSVSLREGSVWFGRLTRAESKAAAKILADWHERLVQVSPLACRCALPPIDLLNAQAPASGLSVVRRQRP
jgi:hypothetical protein